MHCVVVWSHAVVSIAAVYINNNTLSILCRVCSPAVSQSLTPRWFCSPPLACSHTAVHPAALRCTAAPVVPSAAAA